MEIKIASKKIAIPADFQNHAEVKLKKLDRFFGENWEAKIHLEPIHDKVTVELTVLYNGLFFRAAVQAASDKADGLDACVDRIIRQIRKNKSKVAKRLHNSAFDKGIPEDEAITEEFEFDIIKTKRFELKTMDVDEAILQMNLLGHSFFMFKNSSPAAVCVVYKRADGKYGLLLPEHN